MDVTKLKTELGWTPGESFESGLNKTVQWYLDNSEWIDRVRSGEYKSWIKKQYG